MERKTMQELPKNKSTEQSKKVSELSAEVVKSCINDVKIAFPSIKEDYYVLLIRTYKENKFTDDMVRESVKTVIKNCKYPVPTIAEFLNYCPQTKMPKSFIDYGETYFLDFETGKYYNRDGKLYR